MNILLTSAGRRSYLVRYFKEALGDAGEVHAANSSPDSPALKFADKAVVTPLIYDDNYINFLKAYCKENRINAILSLFDIDLPVLSKHKEEFDQIGVTVIVSGEEVIDICNDKLKTFNFLKRNGFNAPSTFTNPSEAKEALAEGRISYPLILKPRWGMGSISIQEADNEAELFLFYEKVRRDIFKTYLSFESNQDKDNCVLIQEKLKGREHGLDVINDINGNYQTTIVKRKIAMRSGETDCAETIESDVLSDLGKRISEKLKHVGNLDMDVFLVDGVPYVLEMNARFGGGYPFSHLAGVNMPKAIVTWLRQEKLEDGLLQAKTGVKGQKDISIIEY